jgi:hypothetical protein
MGGIVKYPPTGPTPPRLPTTLPSPPAPPPAPPARPTGSAVQPSGSVGPNPAINNGLTAQINYSNMRVGYFKIDLYNTTPNIYGEAIEKWYYPPLEIKCLIERGIVTNTDTEYGVDVNQTITITVNKVEFETTYNFTPEVGDIITDQQKYYEINSIDRQVVTLPGSAGANPIPSSGNTPNQIILYVISAYLTRTTKLNLIQYS